MAQQDPHQPEPNHNPDDPNASNPWKDQPLAEPFNRPGQQPQQPQPEQPHDREPQDRQPRFPSDLPQYQRDHDQPNQPAQSNQPGYYQPEQYQIGQQPQPQQPEQRGYHNPQYEWAQGDHSSYPSGRMKLVRLIIPMVIVAMILVFFMIG